MSNIMIVKCPHCGQAYSMTPEQAGQNVQCTTCGKPFTAGATAQTPSPAPAAAFAYSPPSEVPIDPNARNPMAVASLVISLCMCVPFISSIVGIILGIVALGKTKVPGTPGKGLAIAGIAVGGAMIPVSCITVSLMISIFLPSLNRARETANRVKCASNMRFVGADLLTYAAAHGNQFPQSLGVLADSSQQDAGHYVCPSGNNSAPSNWSSMSASEQHAWIDGSADYIYTASGHNNQDPNIILLYEKLENHHDGINVLYGDGHVEFQSRANAQAIISRLESGQNP